MMSTERRIEQKSLIIEDWWEPPMPPTDLIFDDSEAVASLRASGEPMESNRHRIARIAMNILIRSINQAHRIQVASHSNSKRFSL